MAKARILIVEDEAIIASVIAGALKKFNYEVIRILSTGEEAVAAAAQTGPDLILLDIRLQGEMDGIEAAELIQRQADIPIIYLTAYADETTLERAKRTKPYGYIPKPFQEIELKTTIEMALYKHGFEMRLKESEARFRSIFENSQDVIYVVGRSGILEEMNPAGLQLFGYGREELVGTRPDFLWVDPGERREFLDQVWEQRSVRDREARMRKKNGEAVMALITASVNADAAGEDRSFQGIIRDVTEKRKREETLLLLQTAIDASSEAVLIADRRSTIVYGNPAVETMTGFGVLEIIGRNVGFLGAGVPDDERRQGLWATIEAGRSWSGEFVNQRRDGTTYFQRTIISPIKDDTGAITHFVSIASDVTKEKRLEEQMIQAAKMDSLGHLASGIAHDFNNYLTIINGYSEMLLFENENNKNSERLGVILQAGKNASKLVAKILGFSRRQAVTPAVIEVNGTMKDLERMVRRLLGKEIELRLELADDAGRVLIDPTQIEQVLINLVLNARDAMPRGGSLTLATAARRVDEELAAVHPGLAPGDYVAIEVRDSGQGMEPQVLARIFEPFYTTKPKGEGTGLGLASVFGIVHQNRGTVWAESEPGRGSTFRVLLPQVTDTAAVQEAPAAARRFEGRVALLVEDEPSIRELMSVILDSLGLQVHAAADGEQALRTAGKLKRLDLLFCDVVLPGASGVEVADKVHELHPSAAVIFTSGHGASSLKRIGLELPKVNFVEKPSTRTTIVEKIAEVLG